MKSPKFTLGSTGVREAELERLEAERLKAERFAPFKELVTKLKNKTIDMLYHKLIYLYDAIDSIIGDATASIVPFDNTNEEDVSNGEFEIASYISEHLSDLPLDEIDRIRKRVNRTFIDREKKMCSAINVAMKQIDMYIIYSESPLFSLLDIVSPDSWHVLKRIYANRNIEKVLLEEESLRYVTISPNDPRPKENKIFKNYDKLLEDHIYMDALSFTSKVVETIDMWCPVSFVGYEINVGYVKSVLETFDDMVVAIYKALYTSNATRSAVPPL